MKCPHCGGEAEMAKFCPYCDSQLHEDSYVQPLPRPLLSAMQVPEGKYRAYRGYIQMRKYDLVIRKRFWSFLIKCQIPYAQITGVYYLEGEGLDTGVLSIRYEKNWDKAFPSRLDAYADESSISFMSFSNQTFYRLYCFLKLFADTHPKLAGDSPAGTG